MFDINKFSSILENINSNYDTMTDFAKKANFDRTYISKYINKKLNNPPTPKILKKIADNSKGVTTYEELMEVCGYLTNANKFFEKNVSNCISEKNYYQEKYNSLNLNSIEKDLLKEFNIKKEKIKRELDDAIETSSDILTIDNNFKWYKQELDILLNDIYNPTDKNVRANKLIKANEYLTNIKELEDLIDDFKEQLKLNNCANSPILEQETMKIPVVGTVAAGEPILAEQNIIDYEELPANEFKDGEYFGLKIKGNSMLPRILEDDVVIVKQQNDCESGQIAVVLINGDEATVKQVKKMESGIMLIPFNTTEFEPMFFTKEDIEKKPVKIIGVVKRLIGYNFG